MMDLGSVKKDFSNLLSQVQPWTLSHFVMWLDIKVAEYKVFGRMIMDNTPNDTPQWLRASADYLEQQQKEAQAQAAASQGDKDLSPTVPPVPPPPLSPRTAHAMASLRPSLQQITSAYEPVASFVTTSASTLYTVSTVNSTVVSPSVSPAYSTASQVRPPLPVDTFQKSTPPISIPEAYAKSNSMAQYAGYQSGTQRIPPISHLSPKHIRQSIDQGLSMSLPVSLASGKESLTTAEVESQIAVLESQIAAVNRSLKQSAQATGIVETATPSSSTGKAGRRKADTTTDETNAFVPPPYPKKSRQQSPVSASRTTAAETTTALPPLHSSMDMLARMHRLDTESIPESLRSQNITSTLEAFEALRTQTFPPSTQINNEVDTIQNTAQDMSIHHVSSERDQLAAYTAAVDREQAYTVTDREQTYTPTSDTAVSTNAFNLQPAEVRVKVEASQSDEDSHGGMEGLKTVTPEGHQDVQNAEVTGEDGQTYPVSMYAAVGNNTSPADDKLAAEISTKKMRRKFLESMKNSNPKYYSHQIQQIIPFPDKFPVSNLDYGLKALQMIQTGEITRAGKIQLIDTIFHELIKYTGLYPTPTQKMAVANAIVETFPTLAAKMKASHISPADSWYVILCDKFRNERRGLSGAGASPRTGKGKKEHHDPHMAAMAADQQVVMETNEEMELRASEEVQEAQDDTDQQVAVTPPIPVSQATPPQYSEATAHATYQQAYSSAQMTPAKESVSVPEMMSTEEEEEDTAATGEHEKVIVNTEERRGYTEKAKRAVRRKTHSPKRHQKQTAEMPILDERYAASLLEYYSKHKPYYPVDSDFSRHMEAEAAKTNAGLILDEKGVPNTSVNQAMAQVAANQQAAVSQAIAQAVASHAVGNPEEPYSAEVAAIVQTVVSAHMDEVLAARNYQIGPELQYPVTTQTPEIEGTVEVKTSKKKPKIQQKERTPEQQQVTLQRFKQKLAVTYPGVQAVDDATLLCTCGAKVKLGRARMLHNYSNYHLKRCNHPPVTVTRLEGHSPSATPLSYHSLYGQGSPGEINIPTTGPKVIAKEMESAAFAGLSAADRETIQKHFLLNVPTPSSENTIVAGSTSSTPPQSLDLSMPVSGHSVLNIPASSAGPNDLSVSVSGQNGLSVSESMAESLPSTMVSDLTPTETSVSVLNVPLPGQSTTLLENSRVVTASGETASVTVRRDSDMGQSLDLSVQNSSGPSVLIEHQPGSDLRVQIPGSIATSIAEYSGELPDLSAMNALALIQGKTDQPIETSDTNDQDNVASEEPINLADS
ncbi:mucin-17-like isoform X2 [Mercenaria mercenaria]|uniref:mucin-17-like isoform X2 n=1 Tax=Mercenaria mercenaria TaxID=6596 RepID=UPI00234F9466|nr:mucin-17-like isoform X2 [Mercenaria mercenaria]